MEAISICGLQLKAAKTDAAPEVLNLLNEDRKGEQRQLKADQITRPDRLELNLTPNFQFGLMSGEKDKFVWVHKRVTCDR